MMSNIEEHQQIAPAGAAASGPNWKLILSAGAAMGIVWGALYLSPQLQILAGIAPILVGLYLGRRVEYRPIYQGLLTALAGLITSVGVLAALAFALPASQLPATPQGEPVSRLVVIATGALAALTVMPFAVYGVFIASRGRRQQQQRMEELRRRGGRLENPGRVTDVEDLRGLTLPKFAGFVSRLFKKQGFSLDEFVFNKDNHVDIYMTHQEQKWILRCVVVGDKVKPGPVQELAQKMRDEQIAKGVVLTSTEFTDNARRWADNRSDLVVVDGETLMQMAES